MNQLAPIDLIFGASLEVQLVIYILLLLSIISWVMIVQRWMVLSAASKGVFSFEQRFWSGIDLSQLYKEGTQMQKDSMPIVGLENIFRAGFKEFMRLRQKGNVDKEAVMDGSQRAMRVAYSREEEKTGTPPAFSGDSRIGQSLHRSVRYCDWNHECVPGTCHPEPDYLAGGRTGYCGGADRNGNRIVCGNTRGCVL